ncbi:MAG: hypothetical protein ABIT05_01350 [Chitinophagaceae bacterium]
MEPNRQNIINKVFAGTDLTAEEEAFYLVEIVGTTPEEAAKILAIADNDNDLLIID